MRVSVLLLTILLSAWSHADGDARRILNFGGLEVGSLLEKETTFDCGCSFYSPPEAKEKGAEILQWADGEEAHMYVSGSLLSLKVQSPIPYASSLSQTVPLIMSGQGAKVEGRLTSTFVCEPQSESCEVTEFKGTLRLQHKRKQASIPVWGSCGC